MVWNTAGVPQGYQVQGVHMRVGREKALLGAGGFNPASIFAGNAAGMWLDPSDAATVYQDSTGVTPGVLNNPVGARLDKRQGATTIAGPGNHVLQATAPARTLWKLNGAIYSDLSDGVDDGYATSAFAAGTLTASMDCFIAIKRNTAANMVVCSELSAANYFAAIDGTASPAVGGAVGTAFSFFVDGAAVGTVNNCTRLQLGTALGSGSYHVLEVRDLDLSTWAKFTVGLYAAFQLAADVGGLILCPAQNTTNRNSIRTWLGSKVGLVL